jgi:hypothetical protein
LDNITVRRGVYFRLSIGGAAIAAHSRRFHRNNCSKAGKDHQKSRYAGAEGIN